MPQAKPPLTVKNFISRGNKLMEAAREWPTLTGEAGQGYCLLALVLEYHRWTRDDKQLESYIGSDRGTKRDVREQGQHLSFKREQTFLPRLLRWDLSPPPRRT